MTARRPLRKRMGLRWRVTGEHEMSLNRLGFSAVFVAVFLSRSSAQAHWALVAMAIYVGLAVLILSHLSMRPAATSRRRFAAILIDTAILSWQLHAGGEVAAMFFPIYLWIAFGNGFRFGLVWLRIAMGATSCGFGAVFLTTSFWLQHSHLASGLLIGLIALPLYAGTLIRRLSEARQAAERANAARTLFFASVSHELRTPLTAIIGMGTMLRDTRLDPEQAGMARTVGVAATTLLSLIDSILDLSRMEAGRMPAVSAEFPLPELLRDVLSLVSVQARAKQIALKLHVTPRTPINVTTSRTHLLEILINLLGNAVKFTASGGVLLAVDAEQACGRTRLRLDVIDTGIGIAPEAQARIFDVFTQADPSIQGTYGGTGLGLANAKRRAELLGGDITVESTLGIGTRFTVTLELELAPASGGARAAGESVVLFAPDPDVRARWQGELDAIGIVVDALGPSTSPRRQQRHPNAQTPFVVVRGGGPASLEELSALLQTAGADPGQPIILISDVVQAAVDPVRWLVTALLPSHAGRAMLDHALRLVQAAADAPSPLRIDQACARRILLADDNRTNQQVMTKVLERAGHQVVVVSDGDAALDRLAEPSETFDLVLMDVNMPGLDGLETAQLYRAMALGQPHTPIVALTADATVEMATRCHEAGMECCATKPIQPAELLDLVAAMTEGRNPVARAQQTPNQQTPKEPTPDVSDLAVLDAQQIDNLIQLGGVSFLSELSEGYLTEADVIVTHLASAAAFEDLAAFRSQAHALRSSSANVGAKILSDLCASWQHISVADFNGRGQQIASRARIELDRTRVALRSMPMAS